MWPLKKPDSYRCGKMKRRRGTVCWNEFSKCLKYAIPIEVNRAPPLGFLTHYFKAETEDEAVEKALKLPVWEGKVMKNLEAWEEADGWNETR